MQTTREQRWQLAEATVEALRGWQPEDEPTCVLEAVEAVALGRDAEPGVFWSWRQGKSRFQAELTVLSLMEAADYDEALEPPEAPSPNDWTGLIRLTVYEPHGLRQALRRPFAGASTTCHEPAGSAVLHRDPPTRLRLLH